ncbi:TrbC/VirB2 family protein [Streptomonospora nanhaiensis]|uniref:Uncharacterized protein n=1 Tax=Streptomonospora nanhaiensis TaxID=1323731 RepID=A0A853BPM2_9ACTN|nr:TrbC/VirB2 family protein [Streptomonospora nanhaiensis]MBV2366082.1 hypothetical protein [Streptomonospora nanhaiensis]MBX9388884.1 hypothetical protein [Streptomonospora nanhaiensis]NYI96557.1 hypothetical protein [Streptomonospora nanhaiensis]
MLVMLGRAEFIGRGNELLGYVAGLGVLVGVIALVIIGGRMIHANFTGDPWIAARGMADLPYVVLGVILLIGSGTLAANLLQGSIHQTNQDISEVIDQAGEGQREIEQETRPGCLPRPEDDEAEDPFVCPEDDDWDDLSKTIPVQGNNDPRCKKDDEKVSCYEYCYVNPGSPIQHSPCLNQDFRSDEWIWGNYACPVLDPEPRSEAPNCPDGPMPDDAPDGITWTTEWAYRQYACQHFRNWVNDMKEDPDRYCDRNLNEQYR